MMKMMTAAVMALQAWAQDQAASNQILIQMETQTMSPLAWQGQMR
jgi:hypothetical protein